MQTIELLTCSTCKGKGREKWYDFEGSTWKPCTNCQGKDTIEFVVTDMDVALDAEATVTEIERHINPMIEVNHPNMTPAFFDNAIKRAHDAGLAIRFADNGTAFVTSASDPTVSYLVTRTECGCCGYLGYGRCLHRALLIAHLDVFGAPVAEPVAA